MVIEVAYIIIVFLGRPDHTLLKSIIDQITQIRYRVTLSLACQSNIIQIRLRLTTKTRFRRRTFVLDQSRQDLQSAFCLNPPTNLLTSRLFSLVNGLILITSPKICFVFNKGCNAVELEAVARTITPVRFSGMNNRQNSSASIVGFIEGVN
jgi:hypothetical protein